MFNYISRFNNQYLFCLVCIDEELSRYKQHKLNKKKYRRLNVHVDNKNEQWDIDLAENKDLSRFNNQYRFWLVCIDVYSRYVWVELLKKNQVKTRQINLKRYQKSDATPQKISFKFSLSPLLSSDFAFFTGRTPLISATCQSRWLFSHSLSQ